MTPGTKVDAWYAGQKDGERTGYLRGMESAQGYVNDAYARGRRTGALTALGAVAGLVVWAWVWRARG